MEWNHTSVAPRFVFIVFFSPLHSHFKYSFSGTMQTEQSVPNTNTNPIQSNPMIENIFHPNVNLLAKIDNVIYDLINYIRQFWHSVFGQKRPYVERKKKLCKHTHTHTHNVRRLQKCIIVRVYLRANACTHIAENNCKHGIIWCAMCIGAFQCRQRLQIDRFVIVFLPLDGFSSYDTELNSWI